MPRLGCVFDHITGMPSGWTSFLAHYECVLDHITGAPPLRFVLSDCDFDHVTGVGGASGAARQHAAAGAVMFTPRFRQTLGGPGEAARKAL